MKITCTCKEAAALMLMREDRPLTWSDRLALRLHLVICRGCPRFENQVLTMREAMNRWRHYSE